jgi:arsenate reductase-like glutaredoxin family protein
LDARKTTLKEQDALALVRDVDEIYSMKGKKILHIDLKKEKPDNATLAGLLLGPTGNLRAPTLRKGRTLIVGFEPETYAKILR